VFTRAEAAAASIVAFPAAAIILAYCADAIGLTLHPIPILLGSIAAASCIAVCAIARSEPVEPRGRPSTSSGRAWNDMVPFGCVVGAVLAWLLWLAWPHLLPIGGGSDLTHHLLLIDYIDRTGRLVHDPGMVPYLGEMAHYTPGAHLLAVVAGRWMRTDGLHAMYPVLAASVAIKAGVVFLIARRCVRHVVLALVAPLLLFLPSTYSLGSFAHDSFFAQVVGELFAVTAWWAIVCWDQEPSPIAAAIAGLAGTATFLTWPVWIGPVILTFAAVAWFRGDQRRGVRARHFAVAVAPVAAVAVLHAAKHFGAAAIAGAPGFAPLPTPGITGWLFPALGVIGTAAALFDRRQRTIPILLAAIAIQAVALVVVARASAAEAPYLALKMFYLAIYPLAVAGAIAIAAMFRSAGVSDGARGFSRASPSLVAWSLVLVLILLIGRFVIATPRPTPAISDSLLEAGRWARTHVPPACVDYLVADDDSAYWLHLVVLGNPRAAPRSLASDTFEPQKALVRWILPGGLPYAIADDVSALPKDISTNVDVLARFGSAAVVKRHGESSCPER